MKFSNFSFQAKITITIIGIILILIFTFIIRNSFIPEINWENDIILKTEKFVDLIVPERWLPEKINVYSGLVPTFEGIYSCGDGKRLYGAQWNIEERQFYSGTILNEFNNNIDYQLIGVKQDGALVGIEEDEAKKIINSYINVPFELDLSCKYDISPDGKAEMTLCEAKTSENQKIKINLRAIRGELTWDFNEEELTQEQINKLREKNIVSGGTIVLDTTFIEVLLLHPGGDSYRNFFIENSDKIIENRIQDIFFAGVFRKLFSFFSISKVNAITCKSQWIPCLFDTNCGPQKVYECSGTWVIRCSCFCGFPLLCSQWISCGEIENCANHSGWYCVGTSSRHYRTYTCSGGSCTYSSSLLTSCGSSGYEYRCSGQWIQRQYVTRGCSGGSCSTSYGSWTNHQYCGDSYYEYRCSNGWIQRRYVTRGCSGSSCSTSYGSWTNHQYCGDSYYEYRCLDNKRQSRLVSRGCSGTSCYISYGSWINNEDCNNYGSDLRCAAGGKLEQRPKRVCHKYSDGSVACISNTSGAWTLKESCGEGETISYRCSGSILQKKTIEKGCSNNQCYVKDSGWSSVENCSKENEFEYQCDENQQHIQKRYKEICDCPGGQCSCLPNSNGEWSNSENCFQDDCECREIDEVPQCVAIPSVDNLSYEFPWDQYCGASDPIVRLSWKFVPSKCRPVISDDQEVYEIKIKKGNNEIDKKTGGSEKNYYINENLNWNESYNWEIRVKGGRSDFYSEFKSSFFETPPHEYPYPGGFEWSLDSKFLTTEAIVTFGPSSYGNHCSGGNCSYNWDIQDAVYQEGTNNKSEYPVVKFDKPGVKEVTLTITDNELEAGGWGPGKCSSTKRTLSVTYPLPHWQEIPPFLGSISNFTKNVINYVKNVFSDKNY